ncbi:type I polyketide synthase [Rhizobium nepotum]|uniref:Beta-ketoacyl synthase n=1 Tax=Rhizobium nepotum 39/7 TaxID=1368418 RepID=A0ABR5CQD2_9HYPH|nr:type I polyketide synthase [Rhizobium nepotum]KJF67040.1 hypothetical protein RS75_13435 [Rhizobium nepotum 39/7]
MSVEIIGRSVRTPSARNVDELFQLLKDERCVVTSVPEDRWSHARFWHPVAGTQGKAYTFAAGVIEDVYDFDPAVFNLTAREATYMDPQQRVVLQLVWRALEDASITISALQRERVGVYIGASSLDSGNTFIEDPASGSPYFMTGNTLSIIANRISHVFGLNGPSLTIDTACSSSLVALDQAVRALRSGDIDTAIVGGVNVLAHPFSFVGFSQARMLSPEGLCRAYGEGGQGYVRSEGGGVVVLRTTERARSSRDRSYARILATGLNSAGRTNGISLPSREMQASLLRDVYERHNLDPNDLAFIEGHGTGTKVGDPAELWAIGTELGQKRNQKLLVGSVKSNVGHSEPASGMFGLIKASLALQYDFFPASLHAAELNSEIDFEGLNVEINRSGSSLPRGQKRRLAGINSFGFGGTNAHIVLADPEEAAIIDEHALPSGPFMVSAQTRSALEGLLENYVQELKSDRPDLRELVAVSAVNRTRHRHRFVVDSEDPDLVRKSAEEFLAGSSTGLGRVGEAPAGETRIAFAFSGNGSQWIGMAQDAYRYDRSFFDRFNEICAVFKPWLDIDLASLFVSQDLAASLPDTRIAQALLFTIQATLSDHLISRNIKPSVVFGHSVGEIAAAYCAGALSLEHAVAVVAVRSRHQHALFGEGKMAAVALSPGRVQEVLRGNGLSGIEVGAINTRSSVTISGPASEIKAFKEIGRTEHIPVHILDIDYPFHHPVIDRERDAFLSELPAYQPRSGDIKFISSVTGTVKRGDQLDAVYWWKNVRDVVRFADATAEALEQRCNLFIEIGPRPILSSYLTENARQAGVSVSILPTLTRPVLSSNPLPHIVAQAVSCGASVWTEEVCCRRADVALPPLPFEPQPLQVLPTSDKVNLLGRGDAETAYTLLGWRTDPNAASWKNHIDANLFPDLAQHVVDGKSILPGSAFIEIAVQAAQQFFMTSDVEVRNLEITRPLELHENRLAELSTVISPETGQIEIRSREYLSEDDWSVHAVARIRRPVTEFARQIPQSNGNISEARTIDGSTAYRTARQFGLDYGVDFRLLENVRVLPDHKLHVRLLEAGRPAHPYLSYNLNPISIDAAFHGLVALFADLTGDLSGAPYIPVRFGAIRSRAGVAEIRSAQIEILRASPFSLKIRVELLGEHGELIASLDDCRFRRTFLKVHHSLETVSFHYERIAITRNSTHEELLPSLVPQYSATETAVSALVLDAAVYRAAYDIARKVQEVFGSVDASILNEHPSLKAYLSNCFFILEDYGLATFEEECWLLASDPGLPAFADIIRELIAESPEISPSAILVNDAYQFVMSSLDLLVKDGESANLTDYEAPEATVDHFQNGTPIARKRIDEACRLVEAFLEKAASGRPGLVIAEIGATSVAVSTRLATLAERYDAKLVIIEDDENLKSNLAVGFAKNPRVDVVDCNADCLSRCIDLVISANGFLLGRLQDSEILNSALISIGKTGAELCFIEHQYASLADFVFGLREGWFRKSVLSELPVGKMLSNEEMMGRIGALGFANSAVVRADFDDGSLTILTARGEIGVDEPQQLQTRESLLMIKRKDTPFPDLRADKCAELDCGSGLSVETLRDALTHVGTNELDIVLVLPEGSDAASHSSSLQDDICLLSDLAEAVRHYSTGVEKHPPRLIIVAPGGAPTNRTYVNPVNHAIWTFARVLQNEYDEIDIVTIDIAGSVLTEKLWRELLTLQEQGENELLYDVMDGSCQSLRVVSGPSQRSKQRIQTFQAASIVQRTVGRIETIEWQENMLPTADPGDVVVEVSATGLNFRDVMWAMGMLPEEALEDGFAGATIGMEFSGTVLSVGSDVHHIYPGDRVMGIGPNAFSTHVVVPEKGVTRIPDSIDLIEAATLPVTFLTAYYALVQLAGLRSGETVLIHGAAGGVGLAALQIAKLRGATIIATAGTVEKRNLLATLGADFVFDSRSLEFFNDVLRVTDGLGVDVVINSLFQEAMERSLELVKPFGRFLELGKRDYYADRKIGLRPFRKNISYFGIDADQLLVEAPHITSKIFEEISTLFAENTLKPLPYRAFSYDEISTAFRLMQSAGHIGKIVVTPPARGRETVLQARGSDFRVSPGTYLVIGGIGGFGLEAANWLAAKGASHLALATRSGTLDDDTRDAIARWHEMGIKASVHACDVTNEAQLCSLLADLRKVAPLKGVVHAAMVLDDALISNLSRERNRPVVHTKVEGAVVLDKLTDKDDLDLFLLFSSATTMVGNPGQSNYVAANGYLEGLARARRLRGKPALAVGFGAIADKGFLARNTQVNELLSKRIGKTALKARDAMRFVEEYLIAMPADADSATVMIADIDWATAATLKTVKQSLFSAVSNNQRQEQIAVGEQMDLHSMVADKSAEDADAILHSLIAAELASILKMAENNITPDKVLRDIGLDSLMAMELGTSFQQKTGIDLPLSSISDSTTVSAIVGKLREKLLSRQSLGANDDAADDLLEGLANRHSFQKLQEAV